MRKYVRLSGSGEVAHIATQTGYFAFTLCLLKIEFWSDVKPEHVGTSYRLCKNCERKAKRNAERAALIRRMMEN